MKFLSLLLFLCILSTLSYADNNDVNNGSVTTTSDLLAEDSKAAEEQRKIQSAIDSLESTQLALVEKLKEQDVLQSQLKTADDIQKAEVQAELDEIAVEIKSLKNSFEQVAIGGISLDDLDEEGGTFDWKEELLLITQPVLESLKGITEKPRNLERFRSTISERESRAKDIAKAITSLG